MSILLDALRRGRARQTTIRPNPDAAHTDAVLQTLGYRRVRATPRRLDRLPRYLIAGVVLAVVVGAAIIWIRLFFLHV